MSAAVHNLYPIDDPLVRHLELTESTSTTSSMQSVDDTSKYYYATSEAPDSMSVNSEPLTLASVNSEVPMLKPSDESFHHSTYSKIASEPNTINLDKNDYIFTQDTDNTALTVNGSSETISDHNNATFSFQAVKTQTLLSLKRNIIPAIVLNSIAILILVLFYTVDGFHDALSELGNLRKKYGVLYSFTITSIFGGFIPYLIVIMSGSGKVHTSHWILTRFYWFVSLWGLRGIELDSFYRLQAYLFGEEQNVKTIVTKTCIDQFVYNIVWVVWFLGFVNRFELNDFQLMLTYKQTLANKAWWLNDVVVGNISSCIVWIPASSAIYALSSDLQTTLLNIVLIFWVLLVRTISQNTSDSQVVAEPPTETTSNSDRERSELLDNTTSMEA